jgi:hypothetical protein
MGAGKQPRFAAALPPVKLDALFTFDSTRDAFRCCLAAGLTSGNNLSATAWTPICCGQSRAR